MRTPVCSRPPFSLGRWGRYHYHPDTSCPTVGPLYPREVVPHTQPRTPCVLVPSQVWSLPQYLCAPYVSRHLVPPTLCVHVHIPILLVPSTPSSRPPVSVGRLSRPIGPPDTYGSIYTRYSVSSPNQGWYIYSSHFGVCPLYTLTPRCPPACGHFSSLITCLRSTDCDQGFQN